MKLCMKSSGSVWLFTDRRCSTQVLRWGALVFGVFYGFSHQSSISARDRNAKIRHEYEHKQKLIDQAKSEWKKKTSPPDTSAGSGESAPYTFPGRWAAPGSTI